MKKILSAIFLSAVCSVSSFAGKVEPVVKFVTPGIVRVWWPADKSADNNGTGITVYETQPVDVATSRFDDKVSWRSEELIVEMNTSTTALTFIDARTGKVLLSEDTDNPRGTLRVTNERIIYDDTSARMEQTANGIVTVKDVLRRDTIGVNDSFEVNFLLPGSGGLYGLGSHMEDYMNLLGKTVWLTQHNLKATVPVLNSTEGFGLLFDAGCAMKFSSNPVGDKWGVKMEFDAARGLDYYFIKGERMEDVVEGYRYLTGPVSMMPRYLFGYIQSKERYKSSTDLISTVAEYRRRHVPLDMIVQDWAYWPEGWGYMKMDSRYYPSPRALADSIHDLGAKLMVSIWPNPQGCPQEQEFKEQGHMLEHSVYDAFNPEARRHYWEWADREFFSAGFDAWWCDSSEPLDADWNQPQPPVDSHPYGRNDHERRWMLSKEILSSSLGIERSNLYSLYHSMGIYENQRQVSKDRRVVNLTRSSYAGQQRYGTIVWNGDTYASWDSFRQQIPSGLNYMSTGNPYWTVDVGAFFTRNSGRWFCCGEFPDGVNDENYREFYVRMFQWATFLPVLRSHGTETPREIWQFGEPGTPHYDAILSMINMRYTLVPYIYSMAAAQNSGSMTMARPLPFDYPDDSEVLDIKDQYMFGDILVSPVTSPRATSRRVYLPAGDSWIDMFTGNVYDGGKWIDADAPIDRLPLFVRSGAIIPSTEVAETTAMQVGQPITLTVYPGADGKFIYYDDAGDGYRCEEGDYVTVPMEWNDASGILSIGAAKGNFPPEHTFNIMTPRGKVNTVRYIGEPMTVSLK